MHNEVNTRNYKLCFIGYSGVGKTSIVERYVNNKFENYTDSTIGASFQKKEFMYKKNKICLQMWDTAGQERYRSLMPLYFRQCNAILLVVDINSKNILDDINVWTNEVRSKDCEIQIFLVVNKCDDETLIENNNIKLIEETNIEFICVSAKTGKNINELFVKVLESIYDEPMIDNTKKLKLTSELEEKNACCIIQ